MIRKNLILSGVSVILIFFLLLPGTYSCEHNSKLVEKLPDVCFDTEILPIFRSSCGVSGCHNEQTAADGYIFTTYENIVSAVKPGEPEESPAYTSLINFRSEKMMPPDRPLSKQNRMIIRVWIEQGAAETICDETNPNDTAKWVNPRVCFQRDILPVLRSSCALSNCHDEAAGPDGLVLTSYSGALEAVLPGDPENSGLYTTLLLEDSTIRMPPYPYNALPQYHIDSIYNWIEFGALDEYCGPVCDTTDIGFQEDVFPIILNSCTNCHSGEDPDGGVYLTDYSEIASYAGTGALTGVLRASGYSLMPPAGPLPECKIRTIEIWVENGSINNKK